MVNEGQVRVEVTGNGPPVTHILQGSAARRGAELRQKEVTQDVWSLSSGGQAAVGSWSSWCRPSSSGSTLGCVRNAVLDLMEV